MFDKDADLESIVEKVNRISFLEIIGLNSFRSFPIQYEKLFNISTFPEGILRENLFYPFHLYLFISSIPNLFHHTISC